MDYKNKLIQLRNDNPNFAVVLEEAFPEIVDNAPFALPNQLFMKRGKQNTVYHLKYDEGEYLFHVINLKHLNVWQHGMRATNNESRPNKHDAFLTKTDFTLMMRRSGARIENIKLISLDHLHDLHDDIFTQS